eukprot:6209691-Pleurochrysis_carterae.AAC.1
MRMSSRRWPQRKLRNLPDLSPRGRFFADVYSSRHFLDFWRESYARDDLLDRNRQEEPRKAIEGACAEVPGGEEGVGH